MRDTRSGTAGPKPKRRAQTTARARVAEFNRRAPSLEPASKRVKPLSHDEQLRLAVELGLRDAGIRRQPTALGALQKTLDTLGFGGAAHPIRRLHHLGGPMVFPLGGGPGAGLGKLGRALSRAGEEAPKPVPIARGKFLKGKREPGMDLSNRNPEEPDMLLARFGDPGRLSPKEREAALMAIHRQRTMYEPLSRFAKGRKARTIGTGVALYEGYTHSPWGRAKPPQEGPTKQQAANQQAKVDRKLNAFLLEVDIHVRTGHMTKSEAAQARRWARSVAGGGQPTMDLQHGLDYLDHH